MASNISQELMKWFDFRGTMDAAQVLFMSQRQQAVGLPNVELVRKGGIPVVEDSIRNNVQVCSVVPTLGLSKSSQRNNVLGVRHTIRYMAAKTVSGTHQNLIKKQM